MSNETTRESVMQELLAAASDSLRRKQPQEACSIVAAYEALHRCTVSDGWARFGSRPLGLEITGAALRQETTSP